MFSSVRAHCPNGRVDIEAACNATVGQNYTNAVASHAQSIHQNGLQATFGFHTPKAVTYHEPTGI
jgi:hypothetical protein